MGADFSVASFLENFLAGVSRALFITYVFLSPFFIEDELRRVDKRFNIAQIFLPVLALVKLFFGLMHVILKSNSKEVTKLLITMIFLSGVVLHSNLSSPFTFKEIYFNGTDSNTDDNSLYFFSFKLPNILDTEHPGAGMTANVALLAVNSTNLMCYHWLIVIGIVSSICCHMILYSDYSKIGRLGLGVFFVLYGVSILVLSEFQRPWIHFLSAYNVIDASMKESALQRTILIVAFICCACGISLVTVTKYKKLGIFIAIGYIVVMLKYEVECLLVGQSKRREKDIGIPPDAQINMQLMLEYHEQYIYPTDYTLIRILNLGMVLSGTLFEMLKIYHPEAAELTQKDYSTVDEEDEKVNNEEEVEQEIKEKKKKVQPRKKRNRKNKSQKKKLSTIKEK